MVTCRVGQTTGRNINRRKEKRRDKEQKTNWKKLPAIKSITNAFLRKCIAYVYMQKKIGDVHNGHQNDGDFSGCARGI